MAAQLTKLREERLRQEVTCLKERSNRRQVIEQTLANATIAAQETTGLNLQDLGLFGKIRLDCFKLGKELSRQILQHSERVTRAKKWLNRHELRIKKLLPRDSPRKKHWANATPSTFLAGTGIVRIEAHARSRTPSRICC